MDEVPKVRLAFDHVSVSVSDVEASASFYCDLLGFTRLSRPDFGFPGAWLDVSGMPVHLTTGGTIRGIDAPLRPNDPHFAVRVSGALDSLLDRLRAAGVRVHELQDSPAAERQTFVLDPDGNVIELCVYADSES